MPLDTIAERDILADRGMRDLTFFCTTILGLDQPDNIKSGWWDPAVHGALCEWLQTELEIWLANRKAGVQKQTYIACIVPRKCGKSQIITQAAMLWLHLKNPGLSTYIGNESLDLAESLLAGIKQHMTSVDPWHLFRALYGDWSAGAPIWKQDVIEHAARISEAKDPSFGTFSPTSGLTGRHPDIICMDDMVSYDALARKADWFSFAYGTMTDLIPVVETNGLILLVGTRYGDGDPFGRSFKADGIASISGHSHGPYKVKEDGTGLWKLYFLDAQLPDGTPAIPTCWPADAMLRYAQRDPVKFASQIRNNPRAHGLNTITEEQFNSMVIPEASLPSQLSVSLHLDTAFKHEKRVLDDSETVCVVAGHPRDGSGRVFILAAYHNHRWRAETFAEVVMKAVAEQRELGRHVIGITDEQVPGGKGGLFETWLSNYFVDNKMQMPPFITLNRQSGAGKDTRISEAIAFVVRGHVSFMQGMVGIAEMREQLVGHPYSARKDIGDAFADIFNENFYQQRLPAMLKDEPYAPGGYEESLKLPRFWQYAIMSEEGLDRPPLGHSGNRPRSR